MNWHDVRNVVRVQANIALWAYAAERDAAQADRLKQEWNRWTDLRLAFMFEEFVAQERFQRAVWEVFTAEQRRRLVAGELDSRIRKNTGHSRSFSAHKQVLKALGQPPDKAAWDTAVANWEKKWKPVAAQNEGAARFERQRELAMDQADETFAVAAWSEQEAAFRGFVSAERDAIRNLVQAGYQQTPDLAKKAAEYQQKLRAQMLEKYSAHAGEFLRQLGERESLGRTAAVLLMKDNSGIALQ